MRSNPSTDSRAVVTPAKTLLSQGGALLGAKVVFVVAGYALYVGLSRLLTASQFGMFLVVNSTVAVMNAAFVSGSLQTVSKFVAERPESSAATLRTAFRLHALLVGVVAGLYFLLAPVIAAALNDESLTPLFRLSAVIPMAYIFYASLIGYANGLRHFGQQAAFDTAYSLVKLTFILTLSWMGYEALGAIGGFSAASVVVLSAAWLLIGQGALRDRKDTVSVSGIAMFRYEAAVMAFVGISNLLMQADILMVKAWTPAVEASSDAAAVYGTAVKLAQIPYSLLVAVNFLIFPYIAKSTSATSTPGETAVYIRQALRLSLALGTGPAVVLALVGRDASRFVFGASYEAAGVLLPLLAMAYVAFSLFGTASTIINGIGRPAMSLAIAAVALAVQFTVTWLLFPQFGSPGAAAGSLVAYCAGLACSGAYLSWRYGSVIPWMTLVRVTLSAIVVALLSAALGRSLHVVISAVVLGVAFLITLALLREWTTADVRAVLQRAAG